MFKDSTVQKKRILIIGGVAAGPKAAARARRLLPDAEITIVEKGRMISYGSCGIPLFLSGMVGEIVQLTSTASGINRDVSYFAGEKNIKFLTETLAKCIDRVNREVFVYDSAKGQEMRLAYDELVLATGAKPVIPPLPGVELQGVVALHHPNDAVVIKKILQTGVRNIVIIGAGLIGLEAADALAGSKRKITVLEMQEQLLPGMVDPEIARLASDQLEMNGVTIRTGEKVLALEGGTDQKVKKVVTRDTSLDADLVVLACGVRPNADLARECGLAIGDTGGIIVDEYLLTSDPRIYAAGDCTENRHLLTGKPVYAPLASTANKQGRVVGSNLAGCRENYRGTLGTCVMQVFDFNVGRTGLTEKEACRLGFPTLAVLTAGQDAAHYHPLHERGLLKLIIDAQSGKILGVQVAGQGEVIKRLDVLVAAMQTGADLDQIAQLDLGYAPPFATAIDLAIHAANCARNKLQGDVKGINPEDFRQMLQSREQFIILDVRTPEEVDDRPLEDNRVIRIPLYQLRQSINELPQHSKIIVCCELGIRAYEAVRILQGEKFCNAGYLEGGIYALPRRIAEK